MKNRICPKLWNLCWSINGRFLSKWQAHCWGSVVLGIKAFYAGRQSLLWKCYASAFINTVQIYYACARDKVGGAREVDGCNGVYGPTCSPLQPFWHGHQHNYPPRPSSAQHAPRLIAYSGMSAHQDWLRFSHVTSALVLTRSQPSPTIFKCHYWY